MFFKKRPGDKRVCIIYDDNPNMRLEFSLPELGYAIFIGTLLFSWTSEELDDVFNKAVSGNRNIHVPLETFKIFSIIRGFIDMGFNMDIKK